MGFQVLHVCLLHECLRIILQAFHTCSLFFLAVPLNLQNEDHSKGVLAGLIAFSAAGTAQQ